MVSDAIAAFSAHAADYDAERRRIVPCFDAFYGTVVELLSLRGGGLRRVLDLGAGTGLLSEAIARAHPGVELVLVDGSSEMLARAAGRLPAAQRIVCDLRGELPDGPFDAVVSSLAIHHLEHAEQAQLYGRAAGVLAAGGVFVNAEHIAACTPWLERTIRGMWRRAAAAAGASEQELDDSDERMRFNRCVTLAQQLQWLQAAGLRDCECFFKQLHFAVFAGWRDGEPQVARG
jgi:tRNA (cmo5U34)-methyltransferase